MAAKAKARSDKKERLPVPAINGPAKAALWLLSVDEELAAASLGHLKEDEIAVIANAVRNLGHTTPEQLAAIHAEFEGMYEKRPLHLKGSGDYLGRLATRAFGKEKVAALIAEPSEPAEEPEPGPTSLQSADSEVLASLLVREHPQIIAAVLANLEPARSAAVLRALEGDKRRQVVDRIGRLKRMPRAALEHAERTLATGLPTISKDDSELDGVRVAATLLNQLDTDAADEILGAMEEDFDDLASDIRRAMFTFDDLVCLDRKGFQTLLKEVQSDQLMVALKTASEDLKKHLFAALSKRAAAMLKDDLEVMGPMRLADVEQAQQAIVATAVQLQAEGRLSIVGRGGDDYV